MTLNRALSLCLALATSAAFVDTPGSAAAPEGAPAVRLTAISSRVHAAGTSLTIEATEPVPYVTTRPDPFTINLDFRNVGADGLANSVAPREGSPIGAVAVEELELMGARVSRVRISLVQPVPHQVRSERNAVLVELERPSAAQLSASAGTSGGAHPLPDAMQAIAGVRAQAPPPNPLVLLRANAAGPAQAPAPSATISQTTPSPGQPATTSGRQYSGHPISMDFQDMDLRAVLRLFSDISGLNMVIDPTVQGSVNVKLDEVPWDQALDIILRANKLGYVVDGTIVRIAPLGVLAEEEKQRADLARAQTEAGELTTFTRQLSYAKGEELVALLKQANVISQRGQAFVDARTNTLIVTDLEQRIPNVSELITTLDVPQPQVEIEARIVQTTRNYARALGIQWGFNGRVDPALGNTTNLAFPNNGSVTGAVNLPSAAADSTLNLALGSVNGAFNLDVALSALERQGNVRLLSTPRVSTLNNVAAEIAQGIQVPYQTQANNTITTAFKDAALTLKVTPQITASNTVIMVISVDKGSVGPLFGGIPSINTQRANTTVLVNDGETTVIGGIYDSRSTESTDGTPGLSQIPLLKWLFKRDDVRDENSELLIFITPRIIRS